MSDKTKGGRKKELLVIKVPNKIDKETATKMKDQIATWKRKDIQKKLDKSLDKQGYKPTLETQAGTKVSAFNKSGRLRAGLNKGGRAGKQHGGRTNLLEELGRVEGESSNRNRRAEVSRIHGELNKGYSLGGRVGAAKRGFNKKILRKD